jgi:hypothetical protein
LPSFSTSSRILWRTKGRPGLRFVALCASIGFDFFERLWDCEGPAGSVACGGCWDLKLFGTVPFVSLPQYFRYCYTIGLGTACRFCAVMRVLVSLSAAVMSAQQRLL